MTTWQIALTAGGVFGILGVVLHLSRQIDYLIRHLESQGRAQRELLERMENQQTLSSYELRDIAAHYRKEAATARKVRAGVDDPLI